MKRFRILMLLSALIFGAVAGCSGQSSDSFIQEYEGLNTANNSGTQASVHIDVPEDHRFIYADESEVVDFLKNGTGAVYFGFPECPWCRNAVPVMDEAAKLVNLDEILYLNVRELRDTLSLNADGSVEVENPGSEHYQEILELLGEFAPEYEGLEDPSIRRIYVPLVVVVVDGEIITSHSSTVDSQEDPAVPLDPEQHQELLDIYIEMFSNIPGCGINTC